MQSRPTSRVQGAQSVAEPADVVIARATGEVGRPALEACDWLVSQASERTRRAVVDLTGAERVDPRAVVVLVARRRVLYACHGDLAVAATRPEVRQVLRASAGGELPVFATVAEAVQWVRGGAVASTARVGMRAARSAGR